MIDLQVSLIKVGKNKNPGAVYAAVFVCYLYEPPTGYLLRILPLLQDAS